MDLNLSPDAATITVDLILDGQVVHENLKNVGHDEMFKSNLAVLKFFRYNFPLFIKIKESP